MVHGRRLTWMVAVYVLLTVCPALGQTKAGPGGDVPPALDPWRGFVLHQVKNGACPPDGDDAAKRVCLFPSALTVAVDANGANFSLRTRAFDDGAVTLPHGEGVFLKRASLDGRPAPVAARDGWPVVWLSPGEHTIDGRLDWTVMPATLALPPQCGAIAATRDGREMAVALTPDGQWRLAAEDREQPAENSQRISLFRLIRDGVPVTLTTLARLDVSGLARSITLSGLVPEGAVPLAVRSPVPVSFGPGGAVVVDAGPGRYEIEVTVRFPGRIDRLGPAASPYGPEIWSFAADDALRSVSLSGLAAIDPQTAAVPDGWKRYPAVWAKPGETLVWDALGRGAPAGRDALRLRRAMWLDFSGQGLSVDDTLLGENREQWTLALAAPGELGRVTINGRAQPVVLLGPDGTPGVELRQSHLTVMAQSRYPDARAAIPAGGFNRRLERVSAVLNLPPGWNLVTALGPDTVSGAMLSDWTLLDVFLTALLTVAGFSLCGWRGGAALGLYLLLSWQEPDAPTLIWLFVLAGLALARLAGESGRLAGHPGWRRLSGWFFGLAVLAVIVSSLSFATDQLRRAVLPQVEPVVEDSNDASPTDVAKIAPSMPAPREAARSAKALGGARFEEALPPPAAAPAKAEAPKAGLAFDPGALVQTGPAMPTWHFETVNLEWSGPVGPGQSLRLFLLPPLASSLLGLARVVLLGLALLFFCARSGRWPRRARPAPVLLLVFGLALGAPRPALAGDFPSMELLETLRARLTEPAACFPHCLGSPSLAVRLDGGRLVVAVGLDASARTAAPLPVVSDGWRPARVLLDGQPAPALVNDGGSPKVLVEPGSHVVELSGPAPEAVSFTLSPNPAPGRVSVAAPGYRVRGVDRLGRLTGPLELIRAETAGTSARPAEASAVIAPFFEVRRRLDLALTFEVETTVVRRSPLDAAAVASLPLLPGEVPAATPGLSVTDGRAEVAFPPGTRQVSWRSRLPDVDRLSLVAPSGGEYAETWTVVVAPFYDVRYDGPPPVAHLDAAGNLAPRFAPWPGEKLDIRLTRPKAAPGEFVTLKAARLTTRQGERGRELSLVMDFRAAKGLRHVMTLPKDAEVTRLLVAGRETPVTGGPGQVGFSLLPGETEVRLDMRQPQPLGLRVATPGIDLGLPVANLEQRLELPDGRWLLGVAGETPLGPGLLYWGWLAFVLAAGLGLAALSPAPLRRWQWLCYALGLSQATPLAFVLAVSWLVALGYRRQKAMPAGALTFDTLQLGLAVLVLAGLAALYQTLESGLLGLPRMQVAGNGSTARSLVWTFDRAPGLLPVCSATTVPMLVFRLCMLAWALWLAWTLVGWLRWGFASFTMGGGWRSVRLGLRLPGRSRVARSGGDERQREEAEKP